MKERLILIVPNFPLDIRGYKYVKSLFKKYEIYLIVNSYNGEDQIFENTKNFLKEIIVVGNKLPLNFPFNFKREKIIKKLINRINPNIVICRDIFLSRFINNNKKNIKYILDFCDNFPEVLETMFGIKGKIMGKIANIIEKNAIKKFDEVIFVSEESYNYVLEKHKLKKRKKILENVPIVSTEEKKVFSRENIVYIGTINKKIRDFETVFNGLKILKQKNKKMKLDIYYFLNQEKIKLYYENLAKEMLIEDMITFIPAVEYKKINLILSKYKVGLVPHTRTKATDFTVPNKIYDYLHMELPILASDNPSLKKILKNVNAGEIYIGESPKDFADKLLKVYENKYFKEEELEIIKNKFNWEVQIKKLNIF